MCEWVVVCLQVHSHFLTKHVISEIKSGVAFGWDENSQHVAPYLLNRKCMIGLMKEERVFILTHKMAVSFPTCPLAQPTSWGPHSLLHQSSLLTKATEPTHSGVAHCGLYKLVSLAAASHSSPRRSFHSSGRASAPSQAADPLTVSKRPRQRPPELETDCLGAREHGINLIQVAPTCEDINVAVIKISDSTDPTAHCLVEWCIYQTPMNALPKNLSQVQEERFCNQIKQCSVNFKRM